MPRKRRPRDPSTLASTTGSSGDAAATSRKAREEWARFQAWTKREGIPLRDDTPPPDWLVAVYLLLRLTDPTSSLQHRTVKRKTAETISNNLKKYVSQQDWDDSRLAGKATKISSLLDAANKLLPEAQTTQIQARPITYLSWEDSTSELDLLLDRLAWLEAQPAVSEWWVAGWRARLLAGIQGPMRGGEVVTAAISNLRRGQTPASALAFGLTIPVSKQRREPEELVFFCICGEDRRMRCPAHALADWLEILAGHGYTGDALFPVTARYDPRLPSPQPTGPVPLRDAAALRRLASEIVDTDSPAVVDLREMVDVECCFVCRVCGSEARETLRSRAGRKFACLWCGRRAVSLAREYLYESTPDRHTLFVDAVAARLASDSFASERTETERHQNAVSQARNSQGVQLKELCRDAGIAPRGEFESISFHGLKRGGVTTLAAKGVSDVEVQAFAKHKSMDTTTRYIDRHRSYPHATSFLEPWQGEPDKASLGELNRLVSPEDSQAT